MRFPGRVGSGLLARCRASARRIWLLSVICAVSSVLAQTVDVGTGSPNQGVQMAFVNAWSRNGFYLLVSPPTANVTPFGSAGLIQQFPSIANSHATLALIKPDTTSNFNVVQMQANMFSYYSSVGVGTAGYPTGDTMTCPPLSSVANNSCQWQTFTNNYVLFAYASLLASGGQSFATRDPFFTKWMSLGGIAGLGATTSAETAVTSTFNSKATVQTFDGGAIYDITSGLLTGRLLKVAQPIYGLYLSVGAHNGLLGLPSTEPLTQADGTLLQNFEGGAIQYNPMTGAVTLVPAVQNVALAPAGQVHLNVGDTLMVQATVYDIAGNAVTNRAVGWNTSNGRVVAIQANGLSATLSAAGPGTANITATAGGKTSPVLTVTVAAPCCQIGEGAPTVAIQQAIQGAVTRNGLSIQLPAASAVTRAGKGYVQQLMSTGAMPVSYLVTVADGSSVGYVVTGTILTQYLSVGGPAGLLGYPLSDATPGGRQPFANGTLAGNPVQLVTGAILTKWGTLGYETGAAGSPTGAAAAFSTFRGASGVMQSFQNALIVATAINTYVSGVILAQYTASGGPGGDLGAPTDDEQTVNGLRQQDFEGGSINYMPGSNSATVVPAPRQPLLTATPAVVLSGSVVHLVAGGFNDGATVGVSQTGQPDFVVQLSGGVYSWDVRIPAGAASATITVRAADTASGMSAQTTYTVTSVSNAPLKVVAAAGDQQVGAPGAQLPRALVVAVQDQSGNPVPGQTVTFAASPGAQIGPATAVTDANGLASAMLRMPAQEGIALATAQAAHQVVTFSARSAALSLTNFPALAQNAPGGALLAATASILRYHQLRAELPQPNGLADPVSLNQFLKSTGGFVSFGPAHEQTVNLWRVGGFVGGQLDVRIEDTSLNHVRDLVAAGSPALIALALNGAGSHFVVATGIGADGSISIADPNPAGQTSLNAWLARAGITGVVRLAPQAPAAVGFLVSANAPVHIASVAGECGSVLQFPDTVGAGQLYFHPCAGPAPAYQVDVSGEAQFEDLSKTGAMPLHGSTQVVPSNAGWMTAPLSLSITPPGIVNSASHTDQIAPGGLVAIFGTGLSGATVQINGEPMSITGADPFAIQAQIPFDVSPGAASVTVTAPLGTAQQAVTISQTAPAIFSNAIANQDNTANAPANPALRGAWLMIYATGLGVVPVTTPVSVVIGGVELPSTYAGPSGSTAGLYQVNVQLPTALPPGLSLPLYLKQGDAVSNTMMVAIQ